MKCKLLSIGVFLLLALVPSAWAADILGNWIAAIGYEPYPEAATSKAGPRLIHSEMGETIFSFKVDGTELTGTVADAQGKAAIREGKINGDKISFFVIRSVGEEERKLRFKGQVSLNEIRFTLETEGLEGQPLEFIAKREFPRHGDLPLRPISVPKELPMK